MNTGGDVDFMSKVLYVVYNSAFLNETKKRTRRINGSMALVSNSQLADPDYVLREDHMDEDGEMRWHAIGMAGAVLLLVVHVYRSNIDGEEIIQIVSARKARTHEGRGYFQ